MRTRGYNQAEAIARGVAHATGGEVVGPEVIIRTRHTRTQTGFSLDQRRKNLDGAFLCTDPERLRGRDLLLVDDVFTTGATLFELYAACRSAEPASAAILTLAQA
jgi:predicted amidophosphoribosyltransferase